MAIYTDLFGIGNTATSTTPLLQQVTVACVVQAISIMTEARVPNTPNRLSWARAVLANPPGKALQMLWALLGQNASLTTAQINGATDAAILTAVASCVDLVAP